VTFRETHFCLLSILRHFVSGKFFQASACRPVYEITQVLQKNFFDGMQESLGEMAGQSPVENGISWCFAKWDYFAVPMWGLFCSVFVVVA
jgi:hypothetical protein